MRLAFLKSPLRFASLGKGADAVELRPGGTILDFGAGTGFLTTELVQRCGAYAKVIAVDPWKAAMARLVRKVERLGRSKPSRKRQTSKPTVASGSGCAASQKGAADRSHFSPFATRLPAIIAVTA